jgi:glc operon protein GlcG
MSPGLFGAAPAIGGNRPTVSSAMRWRKPPNLSSSSSNVMRNPTSNWGRISMTNLTRFLATTAMVVVGGQLFAQSDTGLTLDKKALTLSAARKVIAAAEAEATKRGLGVVIVVVDDSGTLIELSRMDAAQIASVNVGIGKARTAAIYRRPSRVFEEQIRDGRVAALALADATPLQGGIPILINSKVVGAVGVSGDSPQVDEEIAIAGAKAISSTK